LKDGVRAAKPDSGAEIFLMSRSPWARRRAGAMLRGFDKLVA